MAPRKQKRARSRKKKAAQASFDSETMLRATASRLQSILDGIDNDDPKVAARVSTAIAHVHAQIRQLEKAARRDLTRIPLDQVIEHLKTLPDRTRKDIALDITGADSEDPLL